MSNKSAHSCRAVPFLQQNPLISLLCFRGCLIYMASTMWAKYRGLALPLTPSHNTSSVTLLSVLRQPIRTASLLLLNAPPDGNRIAHSRKTWLHSLPNAYYVCTHGPCSTKIWFLPQLEIWGYIRCGSELTTWSSIKIVIRGLCEGARFWFRPEIPWSLATMNHFFL